jgi:hypothetical protein
MPPYATTNANHYTAALAVGDRKKEEEREKKKRKKKKKKKKNRADHVNTYSVFFSITPPRQRFGLCQD